MIANQKIGKSFMGALNYNLKKLNHPDINKRAELLETNFNTLEREQVRREVEMMRELRPNLSRYVYHTSLNFSKDDRLNNRQLLTIALQYLEASGFTNNQYIIFRHHDAGHTHLHLLANRICFDGSVVSDSNNFRRSEQILRGIEIQYNLAQLIGSKSSKVHAATKDELEMVIRTGKPSKKMLLQEKMKNILKLKNLNLSGFIQRGEQAGIHFLFNQASTGRVTGITYFNKGFKIKGQALGNSFKWAEVNKKINYEQIRDSKAISDANSRTRSEYGEIKSGTGAVNGKDRNGNDEFYTRSAKSIGYFGGQPAAVDETGTEDRTGRERSLEANQNAHIHTDATADFDFDRFSSISVEIAEDEDDARKHRRRNNGRGR